MAHTEGKKKTLLFFFFFFKLRIFGAWSVVVVVVVVSIFIIMPKIELAPWGRSLAMMACLCLIAFSIACFFYVGGSNNPSPVGVSGTSVGIYGIAIGLIFLPFLWPVWRMKQMLILTQIYWFMALLLTAASIFAYFMPPTVFPAILFDLAAVLYLIAAIRKEKHLTVEELSQATEDLWTKM